MSSHPRREEQRGVGLLKKETLLSHTLLLSSGMGRHWPDARGVFANAAKNFLIWTNEEDHAQIISMQTGADIKGVFTRFADAVTEIEEAIKKEGYEFMHNAHLGYIRVCPSNLGTGLRA